MKQNIEMKFSRIMLSGLLAASIVGQVLAGWNGAGVPGGTGGADINGPANWAGGIIDNDYTGITGNAALQLTADHTPTNGLSFGTAAGVLCDLTLNGTNTLTLDTSGLPAYSDSHVLLPSNALSTVTLSKDLTLNLAPSGNRYLIGAGQLVVDSLITGPGGFRITAKTGKALSLYLRNDANNFTGESSPIAGSVYFTSIADSGVPSALGAGSSLLCQACKYIYTGTRDCSSNRRIWLYITPKLQNDSATGSLSLTGQLRFTSKNTTVLLGGISSGTSLLEGNLANHASALTKLNKTDSGVWRLTGMNTFTGWAGNDDISVSGGKLVADYVNDTAGAGSNRVFVAGRSVYLHDGHLVFQGKAGAGNTTYQAMGLCTFGAIGSVGSSALTVDGNSGDATTIILDGLSSESLNSILLFDMAGAATLRLSTALQPESGNVRLVNGVVMSWNGAASYIMFRDREGKVGFPTQDAEQNIVLHTNTIEVTESNAATYAGEHLSLTGDVTRTADLSFSTMVADARANPVTLDMGGKKFQNDNSSVGRGFVAYGAYPVTITNGSHGAQASSYIFNYSTGKLKWALSVSRVYTVGGTGLTELTTTPTAYFFIVGGTARLTQDYNWTVGKNIIAGDGVLEIGADLNGETYGDYTRSIGNGNGCVTFYAGGGFSAYGRDRVVNLGGSGDRATWNVDYFVPDGKPFVLSSPYANSTLIFENEIDLTYYPREFRVRDGSAAVDARLTGTIRSDSFGGSLVKSGDGALELTGAQTYRGSVSVTGGELRLGADNIYASGVNDLVLGNATLDAADKRNVFATLELLDDSGIDLGDNETALSFADSRDKLWTGTLAITGILGDNTLRFGTDNQGLTEAQLAAITYGDNRVRLDEQGYLVKIKQGTLILVL